MNDVLENARKSLAERIESEQKLAEDRRNKQLQDLLDRINKHVSFSILRKVLKETFLTRPSRNL